jgi:hypothetical protein
MKQISIIITMLLLSISVNSQTLINLKSIKGGAAGQIPYSTTSGTLTTLTSSTSLTYSNSILKINPSVVSTETRSAMPLQIGGDFITIGSSASANVTPTFIEFLKSNGAGGFRGQRGTVGYLGTAEMNLSTNMDYTNQVHKYYDATAPAHWLYLGNTNGFGLQYVPANNPNTGDIWTDYGCYPFKVDLINQPATGKGITGFSRVTLGAIQYTDANNTSTVTATAATTSLQAGVLMTTAGSVDWRVTSKNGVVAYQTGTTSATDLNLFTPQTFPAGNVAKNGWANGTIAGHNIGSNSEALNGGVNIGVIGKAVTAKASVTNIGVIGVASNTNATAPVQVGGFFGLTGVADALPASLTSAALMADNGTSTSNILTLRDNATNVFQVIDGGVVVLGNTIRLKVYTVATLPSGVVGDMAYVSDALAPTYNATVTGGGAIKIPVFFDGTNWTCH